VNDDSPSAEAHSSHLDYLKRWVSPPPTPGSPDSSVIDNGDVYGSDSGSEECLSLITCDDAPSEEALALTRNTLTPLQVLYWKKVSLRIALLSAKQDLEDARVKGSPFLSEIEKHHTDLQYQLNQLEIAELDILLNIS
jgi:hypothetical protein